MRRQRTDALQSASNMRRAWMLRGRADNRGRVVVEQTMGLMMMRMMLTVMMVGDVQRASE